MDQHALHVCGAYVISGKQFLDARGYFQEIFHTQKFGKHLLPTHGVQQVSISHSKKDTLRGLHLSQYSKLVTVTQGEVYDVICDLRRDGPSFAQWAAVCLSAENGRQLFIPPGVAHGFLCVRDANVLYVQGGHFNPPLGVDISPFDKELDIFWPCPGVRYIMSSKDMNAQTMQHFIPRSLSFKRKRILDR